MPCLVPLSMLKPYTGDAAVKPLPPSWNAHAAITSRSDDFVSWLRSWITG